MKESKKGFSEFTENEIFSSFLRESPHVMTDFFATPLECECAMQACSGEKEINVSVNKNINEFIN